MKDMYQMVPKYVAVLTGSSVKSNNDVVKRTKLYPPIEEKLRTLNAYE